MNTIAHFLPYIQFVLAIALILVVMLQRPGEGIEGALGGTASNLSHFARRGGERVLFFSTIGIAVLFVISAVIGILLS